MSSKEKKSSTVKGKSSTVKGKTKKRTLKRVKADDTTVIKQDNDSLPQSTNEEKLDIPAVVDEDSGFDSTCRVSDKFSMNPVFQSPVLDEKTSIIAGDNAPLLYWKKMAEKRAVALEKTLHQNEQIKDQIIVLEAENSLLKEVIKRAEDLTEVTLKAILD